jgi:hypothetical protein
MKVTGVEPMKSNSKRGQDSTWTVVPMDEEEEEEEKKEEEEEESGDPIYQVRHVGEISKNIFTHGKLQIIIRM